jgi:hypothetical protein
MATAITSFKDMLAENSESKERDWPEDFPHENGMYMCKCRECNQRFFGHKRRMICKECNSEIRRTVVISTPNKEDSWAETYFKRTPFERWYLNFYEHLHSYEGRTEELLREAWKAGYKQAIENYR